MTIGVRRSTPDQLLSLLQARKRATHNLPWLEKDTPRVPFDAGADVGGQVGYTNLEGYLMHAYARCQSHKADCTKDGPG